jgi:hypothetical protein
MRYDDERKAIWEWFEQKTKNYWEALRKENGTSRLHASVVLMEKL